MAHVRNDEPKEKGAVSATLGRTVSLVLPDSGTVSMNSQSINCKATTEPGYRPSCSWGRRIGSRDIGQLQGSWCALWGLTVPLLVAATLFGCGARDAAEREQDPRAKASYERAIDLAAADNYVAAFKHLNLALKIDPDFPEPYRLRGQLFQKQGDLPMAVEDFSQFIRLTPVPNADAYHERAQANLALKRMPAGIRDLTLAIQHDPENPTRFVSRAAALTTDHSFELALEDLSTAIEMDGTRASYYAKRASVHISLLDFEKAQVDSEKALALAPSCTDARMSRGVCLVQMGNYGGALREFDAVLLETPRHQGAHFHRGRALLAMKHYDGAIDAFDAAVAINSSIPAILAHRATAHSAKGDYCQGNEDYLEALRLGDLVDRTDDHYFGTGDEE